MSNANRRRQRTLPSRTGTLDLHNGSLTGATSLDVTGDGASPGEGFYYLVKLAGDCGSWQTAPDAEPARDAALP